MENEPTKVRKNLVHKESFDSSGLKKVSKMPNKMQEVEMEKLVLSFGGVKDELEKGYKLLEKISNYSESVFYSNCCRCGNYWNNGYNFWVGYLETICVYTRI